MGCLNLWLRSTGWLIANYGVVKGSILILTFGSEMATFSTFEAFSFQLGFWFSLIGTISIRNHQHSCASASYNTWHESFSYGISQRILSP